MQLLQMGPQGCSPFHGLQAAFCLAVLPHPPPHLCSKLRIAAKFFTQPAFLERAAWVAGLPSARAGELAGHCPNWCLGLKCPLPSALGQAPLSTLPPCYTLVKPGQASHAVDREMLHPPPLPAGPAGKASLSCSQHCSQVREGNTFLQWVKGKICEWAEEKMTNSNLVSNCKTKQTVRWSKHVQQSASSSFPPPLLAAWTASPVLAAGSIATACAS